MDETVPRSVATKIFPSPSSSHSQFPPMSTDHFPFRGLSFPPSQMYSEGGGMLVINPRGSARTARTEPPSPLLLKQKTKPPSGPGPSSHTRPSCASAIASQSGPISTSTASQWESASRNTAGKFWPASMAIDVHEHIALPECGRQHVVDAARIPSAIAAPVVDEYARHVSWAAELQPYRPAGGHS